LESEYFGCQALNVFNLFLALSNYSGKKILDDKGEKIKILNKIGKNLFSFV